MSNLPEPTLDGLLERTGPPVWRRVDRRIGFLMVAALLWSFIGQIDQVVTATGKVIPHDKVKVIQHLEGGIIKQINARENTVVKVGDPLIELDLATAGINRSEMSGRMSAFRLAKIRLEAESGGKEPVFPKKVPRELEAVADAERATYRARRDEFRNGQEALTEQMKQGRQRIAELEAKLTSLNAGLRLARQELAVSESLVKDKLTSQLDHFQRQSAVERLLGEVAMTTQSIPGARAALEEAMARKREEESKFRRRAADELSELERKIGSLGEELGRATDQENRAVIRSPIDGVVKNLRYQATGNVVKPGEPIMEVVPVNEELVIEANLAPADRGYVSIGQFAQVKISAYDYFRYGGLDGKVTAIAADADMGKNDEQFFRVTVSTAKSWLGATPGQLPITPGMQGEVDIHVGSRSLFWLMIKPVLKLKHEAFREI
jgi:adhesin transport system membrane fusion protein